MYTLILSRSILIELAGVGAPAAGERVLGVADSSGFEPGRPLFVREADGSGLQALGRLESAAPGTLQSQWSLGVAPGVGWTLLQPAEFVLVAPHTFPLIHREYRHGLEDIATEGGAHHASAIAERQEILRLRIQRPDPELLERLLQWGQLLGDAGSLEFNLTDFGREVRRVALGTESVEIEPEHWHAAEPFDLLMRVDPITAWIE